uniref:PH domain-containing protein n=1 Tax=Malurus cyaneus samueli TaxID=2593467 RepID=A0A8C5X378_9PASS
FFLLKLDEQLSSICKCQQSVGSLENKVHENLSHFTEPLEVKGAEEDGKNHENKNQSNSDASEDRDSEKEGKKKNNCPPKTLSPQQDEILATLTFGESGGSSKGKITLWGKPDSTESISLASGKISAEVKCGSFNVKVEIKEVPLFDSGTKVVNEKRKNSKNKKYCHERQYQKSQFSKCSKYRCPSPDNSAEHEGKYKGSSKHKVQTAINKSASLEINIETKEIQVEYTSRKKNIKVNIKAGEQSQSKACNGEQEDRYWSETDYSVTEALCNANYESSLSFHKKADYTFPDGYTILPPPKEFADCDKMHLDTIAEGVSLYPVNSRKESDSLTTALSVWGEENCFCKPNTKRYEDHTNEKEDFSKDKIYFSKINNTNCLLPINILQIPNNRKKCASRSNVLGQERNNCDKYRDTGPKAARRKSFPDTTLDVPSPVHPRRDSGFYSLPSLKVLLQESKTGDVCNRNTHIPTKYKELFKCPDLTSSLTELCKFPDLTSSLGNLRNLKSSCQYAIAPFNHNITIYPSEPEEDVSLDGTCLLNDHADSVRQGEETEETLMESLHSSGTIHDKKENGHEEPLGNLAMWEQDPESTEALEKEKSKYNPTEKHFEWQNKAHLVKVSPLSRSPSGEFINDKGSNNYASTKGIPKQCSALELNHDPRYAESEVTNEMRGSELVDSPVIPGEVEGSLVQGDTALTPEYFVSGKSRFKPMTNVEILNSENAYVSCVTYSSQTSCFNLDLKSEMNKTRKLPLKKDTRASDSSQEDAIDQWARRRKQFKDSKKCSSTGGSSINSTITEGSINSEDARSVDLGLYSENEDRGFYTENFHSASWVFRGDDVSPDNSPRCLSKRPRPVAIRERTVKIAKGTGNYPWGFRIQFSKPILVTEVDTNSAAERSRGSVVLTYFFTCNILGPDILTMVVGSDISRYPNTPRPTCRGYLHKRTQSAILKGWRKRWFVLKHNGYLHYYKHKKDEGKCRPLEITKLEGAEISVDTSLGKPFVFKCIPQAGNRIFYFCATSNQEMKRWLEAMDKAVHPVHQNHVWVDVTLHNTTLPPLAIKNPECLGLLHQLDRSKDVWVQHYCILKDGCLYFYATLRSTPAQGGLYLQGYIVTEQSLGSKRSVIELKPPSEEFKTFYLCAENVNENKRWITALKASINKWLPLHQAIQDFMNRPLEETRM